MEGTIKGMRDSTRFFAFLRDEGGQATVEYILLLSAVVAVAGGLSRAMLKAVDNGILFFGANLEKNLKTGRVDAYIWGN